MSRDHNEGREHIPRGKAFLAESRQFRSPEKGTSWHIQEAETSETGMSKRKGWRNEIGEEG